MPQDTAMRLLISNVCQLAFRSLKRPEAPHASAARSAALLTDNHLLSAAARPPSVCLCPCPRRQFTAPSLFTTAETKERKGPVIMSPCVVFHPTRCERRSHTIKTISEAYPILPLPLYHALSTALAVRTKQAESHMAL